MARSADSATSLANHSFHLIPSRPYQPQLAWLGGTLGVALVRRQHFFGRSVLVHLASVSLVIPAMVAVIGIAMIHGRAGWVNDLLVWFGGSASTICTA